MQTLHRRTPEQPWSPGAVSLCNFSPSHVNAVAQIKTQVSTLPFFSFLICLHVYYRLAPEHNLPDSFA